MKANAVQRSGNYILDNLLKSLRELTPAELSQGVHVQLATAIAQQVAEDKAGAFTKETLAEAYSDALERIKLLEFRLAGVKIWVGDAFMSAREAKWKAESGENALAKALDFISGDRDNWMVRDRPHPDDAAAIRKSGAVR